MRAVFSAKKQKNNFFLHGFKLLVNEKNGFPITPHTCKDTDSGPLHNYFTV